MTKTQLKRKLRALGQPFTNRAIADIFGLTEAAVQKWPEQFPRGRYYELLALRPELVKLRK